MRCWGPSKDSPGFRNSLLKTSQIRHSRGNFVYLSWVMKHDIIQIWRTRNSQTTVHVRKNKAVFTRGWGEFAQQHRGQLSSIIQCWGRIEASIHQAQAWVSTSEWEVPFLDPVHNDACTDYNNPGLHTCKCPSTWTGTAHLCELSPAPEITSSNYKYSHR